MFNNRTVELAPEMKSTLFFRKHLKIWDNTQRDMSAAVLVSTVLIDEDSRPDIDVILSYDMLTKAASVVSTLLDNARESFSKGYFERGLVLGGRGLRTAQALHKLEFEYCGIDWVYMIDQFKSELFKQLRAI